MSKAVGMSRNVNLDYLNEIARLFISGETEDEIKVGIDQYLSHYIKDPTNLGKTRAILTNTWVNEAQESKEAKEIAIKLFNTEQKENILLSHWCLMNFAYPVFADVCKNIGKMDDNCYSITTANVKKRMVEIWGERTTLIHSIGKIIKTLKDIEALEALPKHIYSVNKYNITDKNGLILIAETIIYLKDKLYVSMEELNNSYEFFPFEYNISLNVLEDSGIFLIDKFGGELVVSKK